MIERLTEMPPGLVRTITDCKKRATYKLPLDVQAAVMLEAKRLTQAGALVPAQLDLRYPDQSHVVAAVLARVFRMPEEERDRLWEEGNAILNEAFREMKLAKFRDDWPFCGSGVDPREDAGVGGIVNPPATSTGALQKSPRGGNQDARRDRKATRTDR